MTLGGPDHRPLRPRRSLRIPPAYTAVMTRLSPREAKALARRWALVREVEAGERRTTSAETRFRQLAALMASRDRFGAEAGRDAATEVARARWARLRQSLDA